MSIWIECEAQEPIDKALRRFRREIYAEGGFPIVHAKWHKPYPRYYNKPSTLRRRRRWLARARKRGCGYGPDPDQWWCDDSLMRPRRSWGRMGLHVIT